MKTSANAVSNNTKICQKVVYKGENRGVLCKILYGEALPRVPVPFPFGRHFDSSYPFRLKT